MAQKLMPTTLGSFVYDVSSMPPLDWGNASVYVHGCGEMTTGPFYCNVWSKDIGETLDLFLLLLFSSWETKLDAFIFHRHCSKVSYRTEGALDLAVVADVSPERLNLQNPRYLIHTTEKPPHRHQDPAARLHQLYTSKVPTIQIDPMRRVPLQADRSAALPKRIN
jgi:hypothetical protein